MRKKFLKVLALSGLLFAGAISTTSCDGGEKGGDVVQTTYTLNKTSSSLKVGETDILMVEGLSIDDEVTWTSTNSAVASVSEGIVTANSVGSAIIKATVNRRVLQCAVTVTEDAPVEYLHVTYDANGGTGTIVDDNNYVSGNKVTLESCTFTAPEGMIFTVWNTKADGTGTNYAANGKMTITADTTLYAQWVNQSVIPPTPVDNNHKIKVNTVSGVTATLSKNEAETGETVTLTIALDSGVSLDGNPTSSQVTINKISDNVFGFVMPDEDVWINIKISLSGDVIVIGDFGATLTDDDQDGIYVASDVVIPSDKTTYGFSYAVRDDQGGLKRLDSTQLDETRCNANVTFNSASGSTNKLLIAGGCTYDFYYDTNVRDFNCYIVRKSVNVLPSNGAGIYSLFDGRIRSQSTIHPQGLTSIHYEKVTDGVNSETGLTKVDTTYDYKKISENRSFAVATDNLKEKTSYVYKDIDTATDIYSVVNTYTKQKVNGSHIEGNNEEDDRVWKINPYGGKEGDYYKPFSAKMDIVPDGFYGETSRNEITSREAKANINAAAHYGSVLEYEIYESHRGDFDGTAVINAANAEGSHITVTSSTMAGGFKTVVSSQLEYNHVESGSTADVTQQYATVYSNEFRFKTNGDLFSMNYKAEFYDKNNWNFTTHTPNGTPITTTIKVTNSYDSLNDNATTLGEFDVNNYFISSIDYLKFRNDNVAVSDSSEKSHIAYGDEIGIVNYGNAGAYYPIVKEVLFTPDTALDLWQCKFSATENEHIIGNNEYNRLAAIGVGTTSMSFTNGTSHSAYTKTISIEVHASGHYNQLFVNCNQKGYDSYNGDRADTVVGFAGKTMTYYIDASNNTGAPISYYLVFETKNKLGQVINKGTSTYFTVSDCEIIHVEDEDIGLSSDCYKVTGHALKINFNTEASNALTSPVSIKAYLVSDYYAPGFGTSTINIVVNPAAQSITNTSWEATYKWANSNNTFEHVTVEFKQEGVGVITEQLYAEDGATPREKNVYNFSYNELNSGKIEVTITTVDIEESSLPSTASSYVCYFEYFSSTNSLGVAMYFTDSEGYICDLFGETLDDEEGYIYIENLDEFSKVVD